ncbi:MAG: hypothetical protein LBC88_01500, partial [Spirochaetaceae bacterium]|nr:hypothetical protein [Spirochaetaceae bacterium]
MIIEQTVDIPADRRVLLEVPQDIPLGRITIAFITEDAVVPEEEQRIRNMLRQYYHTAANATAANREPVSGFIGSHPGFFGGDGVAYQRKL